MTVVGKGRGKRARAVKPAPLPTPKADPLGVWREELQCGGCGSGTIRRIYKQLPERHASLGPKCRGIFMGRPGNRCGWPTSIVLVFVPEQPL